MVDSSERRSPNAPPFDIGDWLTEYDGLPQPQWDRIFAWIDSLELPVEREHELWIEIERQWLEAVGPALGLHYRAIESEHFLLLIDKPDAVIDRFFDLAERCRRLLLDALPGVAKFPEVGKQVVLALNGVEHYYRYVEQFTGGDGGTSGGMQIRQGHTHIVQNAHDMAGASSCLAHELTHASLQHLDMPQWIEEGLAQMFEYDAAGRHPLLVDAEMAREHKTYWGEHGVAEFWRGDGFHSKRNVQKLSYQLAEILIRLLVEDHRPRWFGWSRGKQQQLVAFLLAAKQDDCGAAAAEEHLGCSLGDLAAKFLGPGAWASGLQNPHRGEQRNEQRWSQADA